MEEQKLYRNPSFSIELKFSLLLALFYLSLMAPVFLIIVYCNIFLIFSFISSGNIDFSLLLLFVFFMGLGYILLRLMSMLLSLLFGIAIKGKKFLLTERTALIDGNSFSFSSYYFDIRKKILVLVGKNTSPKRIIIWPWSVFKPINGSLHIPLLFITNKKEILEKFIA